MSNASITAASALATQMEIQDRLAFNVANINTPGFKRRVNATDNAPESFRAHFQKARTQLALPVVRGGIDFTQGDLRQTGNPLDVALQGKGFFKVSTPEGVRYTRNGNLTIDREGKIGTHAGNPVVLKDASGGVSQTGGPIVVTEDGTILQGAAKLGKFDIADFEDPKMLVAENGTLFRAPEGVEETASDASVHQGAIEGSNVNSVTEFISMISVQRNFESVTRLLRNIDEALRRSLER